MRKRILIVDDERDVAMLMHHLLEREPYEIDESHHGADALKKIFAGGYDLVLLDFDMKDIKGDRICLMMRSDDKFKQLPVVIVTAHVEIDEKVFKGYGATEVLYKPVSGEDLARVIHSCLNEN